MKLVDLSEGLIASLPAKVMADKLAYLGIEAENVRGSFVIRGLTDKTKLKKLNQLLSISGWYIALHTGTIISIEAKYDVPMSYNIPRTLYHAAPSTVADKIKAMGLSPRSGSKRSYHPERVYMATSFEAAVLIAEYFANDQALAIGLGLKKEQQVAEEYVIFEMHTNALPGTNWYVDPNFIDGDGTPLGVYTTTNVPRYALREVSRVPSKGISPEMAEQLRASRRR